MESMEEKLLDELSSIYEIPRETLLKHGQGYQNLVYAYRKNDRDYILRVSASTTRTKEEIESELAFIKHLWIYDVKVSLALESVSRNLIEVVRINNKDYYAVTFEKAKGGHISYPDYLNNTELFYQLGKLTGRLHKISEDFIDHNRKDWQDNYYLKNFDRFVIEEVKIKSLKEQVNIISLIDQDSKNYGLIHGDINIGNFFLDKNDITLFDFDECQKSFYVEDIAIQLFYTLYVFNDDVIVERSKKSIEFMRFFIRGYKTEKEIEVEMLKEIPKFLILREMIVHVGLHKEQNINKLKGWALDYFRDSSKRIINRTPLVEFDNRWLDVTNEDSKSLWREQ